MTLKISYIIMEMITICMQESISLDKPPNRQKNIGPAKTWNPRINKKWNFIFYNVFEDKIINTYSFRFNLLSNILFPSLRETCKTKLKMHAISAILKLVFIRELTKMSVYLFLLRNRRVIMRFIIFSGMFVRMLILLISFQWNIM